MADQQMEWWQEGQSIPFSDSKGRAHPLTETTQKENVLLEHKKPFSVMASHFPFPDLLLHCQTEIKVFFPLKLPAYKTQDYPKRRTF